MTSTRFDEPTLERLRRAIDEIAFLRSRGYPTNAVEAFVAEHRALSSDEQRLLQRAVCTEAQYKARAIKEMLPEDILRRPLVIDAHDLFDALTTALRGGVLLEGVDQTFQPLENGSVVEHFDHALTLLGPILREMRPSRTRWLLDEARGETPLLKEKIGVAAKKWKILAEIEIVSDLKNLLRLSANVATNDPAIIDSCKSWCNLVGPAVDKVPNVNRVKLQ